MSEQTPFFDGDDTSKWSGEAARQLQTYPPGQENTSPTPDHPFIRWRTQYGISAHGTIVDFGCGTGLMRPVFAGMSYIGIDQNPDMLLGIKARWQDRDPEIRVYESPLAQITTLHPELKEVADMGCFVTVLQHNSWATAGEILDQAFQVLKPGGLLVLVEGTYIDKHYPAETRAKYRLPPLDPERLEPPAASAIFTPKGWVHFLAAHGFEYLDYDGDCSHAARRRTILE